MASRKVLILGQSGQIASALAALPLRADITYTFCGRPEVDLTKSDTLKAAIFASRPNLVINAAAYTAVDQAEAESALCHAVNAEGPYQLARLCREAGVPLIHLSTEYVFDGQHRSPYPVGAATNPLSVYGASKAAGETCVRETLPEHLIVRLSWLYAERGRNFLTTMLRLGNERDAIGVVNDQVGAPTYAGDVASALDMIAMQVLDRRSNGLWGTFHLANAGGTTWCGFAEEIFQLAQEFGHPRPIVNPIATSDYPTAARRPSYSVLDTSLAQEQLGIIMSDWRDALERCIHKLFSAASSQSSVRVP